jgi:2-desacetyl-2-hydroxyethyl bacteriochlorophyllide A dehydrogenase
MERSLSMKAAVYHGAEDVRVENVKKPVPGSNEVLVAPRVVGVCGSDYHIFTGHWKIETPLILGHEFTGEVIETGPGADRFKPGDRVVIEPAVTCGKCYYCNTIDTNNYFCEDRPTVGFTQNGAFAELVIVPERGLHFLPEALDYEKGALVEPLACAIRGSDRSEVQAGDNVIVLGAGPIGLLLILLTRLRGAARIVATEPNNARRETAVKMGADVALDPGVEDVKARAREIFNGKDADVVIEAVGSKISTEQSFILTRPGGRVCIVGLCPQGTPVVIPDSFEAFYIKELTIAGSSCSPRGTFERAIRLLASNRIEVSGFITHRYGLDDVETALKMIAGRKEPAIKVVINP